jgi:DNA processing protein
MSLCSVIVESGVPGGAIHQGNFTHKQGKAVYVVLPRDLETGFNVAGGRHLISAVGAIPISTMEEFAGVLGPHLEKKAVTDNVKQASQMEFEW